MLVIRKSPHSIFFYSTWKLFNLSHVSISEMMEVFIQAFPLLSAAFVCGRLRTRDEGNLKNYHQSIKAYCLERGGRGCTIMFVTQSTFPHEIIHFLSMENYWINDSTNFSHNKVVHWMRALNIQESETFIWRKWNRLWSERLLL